MTIANTEGAESFAAISEPFPPRPPAINRSHLRRQLRVLEEMLDALESLTVAGQRHNMEKVLSFLRRIDGRALGLSPRNHQMVSLLLDRLAEQTRFALPDVHLFSEHTRALAALLAAV